MVRIDMTLADQPARRLIENDLATNFLVEAAAGTGKTTSLVRRMVALLREGRASPDRIATMTFTRKAAAHLREMFQLTLEEAHRAETDAIKRNRLATALGDIDRCYIGTIHSFCARVLRERPLEAGIDPQFTELEDNENHLLRTQCWETFTEELYAKDSPIIQQMEDVGVSLDDLKSAYELVCDYPDVMPTTSPVAKPDLNRTCAAVLRFLDDVGGKIPITVPDKGWDDLQKRLRRGVHLRDILDLTVDSHVVRLLENFDASGRLIKSRWPDPGSTVEIKRRFDEFRERIVHPALCQWREYVHPILMEIVQSAAHGFREQRLASSQLNFQDLLMIARDMLRDRPGVRQYMQHRYAHILVDEFQDTDPIQAEVMLYLTGEDVEQRDWREVRPHPGALFIVGDPKQSIYRFRRADITTYEQVKTIIVSTGGQVLELTTNFRSTGKICGWVNEVFREIFPPSSTREQAAATSLNAFRSWGDKGCGVFTLETISEGQTRGETVATHDAARIAEWIRWALNVRWEIAEENDAKGVLNRPVEPADFMVVSRDRSRLHIYGTALEAQGIPFEISGGRSFGDSEELAALLPFLRALVDPEDPVSLVTFLRGGLWGLDDNALYLFRRGGGKFCYFSPCPRETDERILAAFRLLREAREWTREPPPGAALARIVDRLGIVAHGSARELGETRSGNVLKALTMARHLSAQGASFAEIVDHIAVVIHDRDIDGMSIQPGQENAVQVMNLHRAKGLEAPIVFLADPIGHPDFPPVFSIDRETEPPTGDFLITATRGFQRRELARPVEWDVKAAEESAFDKAESDRLLYVAATRAKNMLVMSVQRRRLKATGEERIEGPWARLCEGLHHPLPTVERRGTRPIVASTRGVPLDMRMDRDQIQARRATLARPTYAVKAVTEIAHEKPATRRVLERAGSGANFGRVVHRLLEAIMRDPELDLTIHTDFLLRDEGLPVNDRDAVIRLVENARSDELWNRALHSKERLVEVPFALIIPRDDLGMTCGPGETMVQGVIDLVFWDQGGWVIVDYKSDVVEEGLPGLISYYSPQLRHYRQYWESLTGESARAALFFLETGRVVWVD
jgi:ATP-dependent helicase/nuclease subunit A